MLWLKLSVLTCVLFFAIGSVCGNEDFEDVSIEEDEPIVNANKKDNKVEFKVPSKPEDALLALYFSSPDDIKKMVLSTAKKEGVDDELSKYDGKWAIEIPSLCAVNKDYSLVLKSEGKHHAIAVDLGRDFIFDKDEFVVQYEVKFVNGQTCGGAYIKLLSASPNLDLKQFHDKTPYTIMFGPDKCGLDTKLHFIFRHKNPKTGEIQEKHMDKPGTPLEPYFTDKRTHLYTLVIRSDNSFEVSIDQSVVKSGSLLSDFTPAVNPPAEIDDPNDKKPDSWDEREKIPDPDAKKPDDWDESAPQFVVDEEATMPEGWLADTPKFIPDPKAEKPADWNTETDGEWEAPMIENPDCESAPGCGPWEKPKKLNPNYKGKWSPPVIANPNFDGIWKPKKIPNPDYFEDKHPFKMTPIRALGLELWSMSAEIAFDNFYIGTSKKGAEKFAAETWAIKQKAEMEAVPSGKAVIDGIRDIFNDYPYHATAAVAGIFLFIGLLLYCCCRSSSHRDDAYYKKTDEPQPDVKPEESDSAGDKENGLDAERSGSDYRDDEDDREAEEEQASKEVEEGEEEEGEEEEEEEVEKEKGEDEQVKEKPKPSTARQRTRKE